MIFHVVTTWTDPVNNQRHTVWIGPAGNCNEAQQQAVQAPPVLSLPGGGGTWSATNQICTQLS